MVPPVSGFLLRGVDHRETGLVAGADGIQFVPFPGAVEIERPVVIDVIDGNGIGIAAIADDGQESTVAGLQDGEALLVGKLLPEAAHRPESHVTHRNTGSIEVVVQDDGTAGADTHGREPDVVRRAAGENQER